MPAFTLFFVLLFVAVSFLISGCGPIAVKDCNTSVECLESAALNCEPAKGTYKSTYLEISHGPMEMVKDELSGNSRKSTSCKLFLRDNLGNERTCIVPYAMMQIDLAKYNDFLLKTSLGTKLCTGYEVMLGVQRTAPKPQNKVKDLLLLPSDMGEGYYCYEIFGVSYKKLQNCTKILKSGEVQVMISNALNPGIPKDGDIMFTERIVKENNPQIFVLQSNQKEIPIKSIGDDSKAYTESLIYSNLNIVFVKDTYRVFIAYQFPKGAVVDESSDATKQAVEIAQKAMSKLD